MQRNRLGFLLIAVFAFWFAVGQGASLYVDFLWFRSVGYAQVFQKCLSWKIATWLAGFGFAFVVLTANVYLAGKRDDAGTVFRPNSAALTSQFVRSVSWLAVTVFSVILGLLVQTGWLTLLLFIHQAGGGPRDPLFGRPVSYYLFTLPAGEALLRYCWGVLLASLLLSAFNYFAKGHLGSVRRPQISSVAHVHLGVLLSSGFVLVGIQFWLKRFGLLYSEAGVSFGAAYTEIHAWLPVYWVLAGVSLVCGITLLATSFSGRPRPGAAALAAFVAVYLFSGLYPSSMQSFVVQPNEFLKERDYIAETIAFTLKAYDLDRLEVRDVGEKLPLDKGGLERNWSSLTNVRLWNGSLLSEVYEQLESVRPYYAFSGVDLDRYTIGGRYRQLFLSAREIDFSRIPEQAQTWVNRHFQYTHGYGICASLADERTVGGSPDFLVQDIPPQSRVQELSLSRPEIYFGEKSDHPVFVRARIKEFNYPAGNENAFTTYNADRGIPIATFLRRLLIAWELGSFETIFTGNFTADSRILLHRSIRSRVEKIAPFFEYDRDPYIVVHEGRLFWIQDAYTTSNRYPYADPARDGLNYIRNSAKAVIDAYSGDVTFYISDPEDLLIQAYARAFPKLFRPLSAMPKDLHSHLRYPRDLFDLQRQVLCTYHMRDPAEFYKKEDLWQIPSEIYRGSERVMESYYTIMRVPHAVSQEFVLFTPFSPDNRNTLVAWLAGRSDGSHYGSLVLYRFPRHEQVYGPLQAEARITQDPEVSQAVALWGQQGNKVIRGNLLVIPVETSVLYVEPLYLQAEKSSIPELAKIVVVYENQVAMGEDLKDAITRVVLAAPRGSPPALPSDQEADSSLQHLLERAVQHFENSQNYLREGNLAGYGEEQRLLGEVLMQLLHQTESQTGDAGEMSAPER
ncbi:MAG: UPF0182 family protein [Acidobacteriota bacterium]